MVPIPIIPLHGWLWVTTFNGVVYLTVMGLPLAALAIASMAAWRRRRGAPRRGAWRQSFAEVGLVYGTLPWLWMTMMPGAGIGVVPSRVSFVPFVDMINTGPIHAVGNLLVLAALGFCAPMRFASLASLPRITWLAAGCSTLIETAQYVLQLDRVSSVDDVLLNTAGAALAALASRPLWRASGSKVAPCLASTSQTVKIH